MLNPKATALALALSLAASLSPPIVQAATPQQCTRRWDEMRAAHDTGAYSYTSFMSACLRDQVAAQAAILDRPMTAPAGAIARCRDGTYSRSATAAAACAQHRGVMGWLK